MSPSEEFSAIGGTAYLRMWPKDGEVFPYLIFYTREIEHVPFCVPLLHSALNNPDLLKDELDSGMKSFLKAWPTSRKKID